MFLFLLLHVLKSDPCGGHNALTKSFYAEECILFSRQSIASLLFLSDCLNVLHLDLLLLVRCNTRELDLTRIPRCRGTQDNMWALL
jgi:hypothetical protein